MRTFGSKKSRAFRAHPSAIFPAFGSEQARPPAGLYNESVSRPGLLYRNVRGA